MRTILRYTWLFAFTALVVVAVSSCGASPDAASRFDGALQPAGDAGAGADIAAVLTEPAAAGAANEECGQERTAIIPAATASSAQYRRSFICAGTTPRPSRRPAPQARLDCTFAFDDTALPHRLRAVVEISGARSSTHVGLEPGHAIRFDELKSGYATLRVTTIDMGLEVFALEGIAVPETGTAADSRLTDIDLRGRIAWLRALVLDPYGAPIASSTVRADDGAGHSAEFRTDSAGWFAVMVPSGTKQLDVIVPGYRRAPFGNDDVVKLVPE
jgi:hypothetical protein